jgi:hypothetical protein
VLPGPTRTRKGEHTADLVVVATRRGALVLKRVILVRAFQNLRGNVVQCSEARVCNLVVLIDGEAKVRELYVVAVSEQDVLRLDVAVDEAARMDEGQR